MNDTQCLITKDAKTPVWLKIFDALNIAAYAKHEVDHHFIFHFNLIFTLLCILFSR